MDQFFLDLYNQLIKPLIEMLNPLYIALVIVLSQMMFKHITLKWFRSRKKSLIVLILATVLAVPFGYAYWTDENLIQDIRLIRMGGLVLNYGLAVLFYNVLVKRLFALIGYTVGNEDERQRKKKEKSPIPPKGPQV